jgi:hypothetical protein
MFGFVIFLFRIWLFGFEKLDLDLVMFVFWICNFVFRFVNFVPNDKRPKKY